MTFNSLMTAIADKIRKLLGLNTKMGLEDISSNLTEIDDEVGSQAELIEEIKTALANKSTGTDTSDATAAADEIFAGETAYITDGKVTGTFTIQEELTEQEDLISQISTLVATKATPSGTNTNDATATSGDILSGKTAYVKGEKVTGNIATKTSSDLTTSGSTVAVPAGYYASQATKSVATTTQATPSISIDSNGKITASATQTAGYVSAGTKSGTKQMTTKSATTYTPTTANQTIASGTYLTGTQTIKGDTNLVAGNIKSGTSIFGVTGTYEGTVDEDVTAGINAYTEKLATLNIAISALETELQNKASGGSGGGGNVEPATFSISVGAPTLDDFNVYYTNVNLQPASTIFGAMDGGSITVAKNTMVFIKPWTNSTNIESGAGICHSANGFGGTYTVTGDTLTVSYG